jgi:uncharacterized protein (DUF2062 family)
MITGLSESVQWSRLFEPGGAVELIKSSPVIIVDMLVGGFIIGIPLSVLFYYLAHAAVLKAQKRLEQKRARRKLKKFKKAKNKHLPRMKARSLQNNSI